MHLSCTDENSSVQCSHTCVLFAIPACLLQLGISEAKYRVGKTLLFLPDYDILDQLDKVRELIVEYPQLPSCIKYSQA